MRECGFPYELTKYGSILSKTLGSTGVVACMSKYIGRPLRVIPFISISLLVFSPSSFPSLLLDDAFKKRVVVAFVFALFPTRCSRHVDDEEEIGCILFFFLRAAVVVVVNRLVEKEQDEDDDVSSEDSTRLAIDARRNIIVFLV